MISDVVETFDVRSDHATSDAARRAQLPAWLCSVILHAIIFVSAGLMWKAAAPHGIPDGSDRAAGIAVANLSGGEPQYSFSNATAADSPSPNSIGGMADAFPQTISSATNQLPGLPTSSETRTGSEGNVGLPSSGDFVGEGQPDRGTGGNSVSTEVFGTKGTGSKFVYVFDRSSSMGDLGGRPLIAAKHQLVQSLEQLSDIHQFQIVFYNEQPYVFNPNAPSTPRLMYGDEQSKRLASQFVDGITPIGGTRHWEALKLAVSLRPDVIFFLTDGTNEPLTKSQLQQIERTNQRRGTTINVIEFGSGTSRGASFLRRLAQQNNGQYAYVDVTTLQTETSGGQ